MCITRSQAEEISAQAFEEGYRHGVVEGIRDGYVQGQNDLWMFFENAQVYDEEEDEYVHDHEEEVKQ